MSITSPARAINAPAELQEPSALAVFSLMTRSYLHVTAGDEVTEGENDGQSVPRRQRDDPLAMNRRQGALRNDHAAPFEDRANSTINSRRVRRACQRGPSGLRNKIYSRINLLAIKMDRSTPYPRFHFTSHNELLIFVIAFMGERRLFDK